jgi:uroporphyrinogen decarboxylase
MYNYNILIPEVNLKAIMQPRERVHTALSFQEPDRVPTAIGGGPYGIVDAAYFQLLKSFHLGKRIKPFRRGHNISYLDNRVLKFLETDIRYVYPTISPSSPSYTTNDQDILLDAFGQSWKRATPYYYVSGGLLSEAHQIDQIEEKVHWPDPVNKKWFAGLEKRAQEINPYGDYWVTARMITSHGPFQMACDLRGSEEFLTDLSLNPAFATALLERISHTICDLIKCYLEACGSYIHMIELPGDDYAGNENPMLSPAMFRKFIQPVLKQMVNCIKSFRSEIKVMLHSDGAIAKLFPDLIDCGIDVIHPLEPLPATDQSRIKTLYGNKIAFLGGIDISHAMTGSKKDVRNEVRRCIQQLAPGGGFILAPSNHLQADVPAENIIELFKYARLFGSYPIQKSE